MRKKTKRQIYSSMEMELYKEILEIIEFEINDDYSLSYNKIPIKIKNKFLTLLNEETMNSDREDIITFKPLRNYNHLDMIFDRIKELDELPLLDLRIGKVIVKNEKGDYFLYVAKIYDNDICIEASSKSFTELEAKFKVLYKYIVGKEADSVIKQIKRFDKENK